MKRILMSLMIGAIVLSTGVAMVAAETAAPSVAPTVTGKKIQKKAKTSIKKAGASVDVKDMGKPAR